MVESKPSHYYVNNYTQYSQPTTPHRNRYSTDLTKGMTQLNISLVTGLIITKHTHTKEKLKV